MAQYSDFKYGAKKYGRVAEDSLSWGLEIDWNNDGLFDGTNDGLNVSKMKIKRGRSKYLNASSNGFAPMEVGEFTATLDNTDLRYDPFNTTSPLYPNVKPGALFKLRVKDNNTGTVYPIMTGRIIDIRPVSGGAERVTIKGVDDLYVLSSVQANVGTKTNITIDKAIEYILLSAGFANYYLESAVDLLPYWWTNGSSALSSITSLTDASMGLFYIDKIGRPILVDRHSFYVPVETITDTHVQREISVEQPWDIIKNDIEIKVKTPVAAAPAVLWSLQDKPSVDAGKSLTIWASYVIAASIVSPDATDATFNSASDGSGSALSFAISMVAYGDRAKIIFTNSSVTNGYITLLRLRGVAIPVTYTSSVYDSDAASILAYGSRKFTLDNSWIQNSNVAKSYAAYLAQNLPDVKKFPTIRLKKETALQFTPELFDRVHLEVSSIDDDYAVSYIEHEWLEPSGNVVQTTFKFQPAVVGARVWRFPTLIGQQSYFAF